MVATLPAEKNHTDCVERPSIDRPRLVVVGGGMAAYGLCDRLVRSGAIEQYQLTIIGDEPTPAYDRVNLSSYFDGRSADQLLMASRQWYRDHQINLITGHRVREIDRTKQVVIDDHNQVHSYDQLVLATGSSPFVPPIPGTDQEGVFVYRTLADLERIESFCESRRPRTGAVIGGGLLGLEAAKILKDLGLSVSVIEMAPGLMPRQLDAQAAQLLKKNIQQLGVEVHLVRRTKEICQAESGLSIRFFNADDLNVDLLIVAAGVRPNDQLGKLSGLVLGPRGGVQINQALQTSDPKIFAIGECASYDDHVFGLVAPCYRMADVLAQRLSGGKEVFEGADESAELKLMGIQVATLGRQIGDSPGGMVVSHHSETGYRKLLLEHGRIVGASCVGTWQELPQVRQAIAKRSRLWPWQRKRFLTTGSPWSPGGAMPVSAWPGDAVVCSCLSIDKSTILECVGDDAASSEEIVERIVAQCGASTACGSCRGLVNELAGQSPAKSAVPGATTLMATGAISMLLCLLWLLVPPIPTLKSVQSDWRWIDAAWRGDFGRQVTGYALIVLTLLGMLFSARKRWSRFSWGSYGFWRTVHGVLGTVVLIAMAVHTGVRLGSHLNFLLGICFWAVILLGAVAGMASSMESRAVGVWGMQVRKWRPKLAAIHLWLTWPLPILIGLHVLGFYWFRD